MPNRLPRCLFIATAAGAALAACIVAAASLVAAPAAANAPTLVRQPYLQRVGASHATIVWASREAGPASVRYQSSGVPPVFVSATTTLYTAAQTGMPWNYYQHEATLTGLAAATTYQYDVFVGGVDATPVTDELTTAPQNGTGNISFIAFGDSGGGTASQFQLAKHMAAQFAENRWDLAIHTGDVVYPKGSYPWLHDRFFAVYQDWLRRHPIFLAIGNHEDSAEKGKPYLNLFTLPDNGSSVRYPDHRERYYSFDYGPVHFIALDTQIAFAGSQRQEQLTWLVRDLEATTQPWRIAFFHIPGYGSSDFASTLSIRYALQPIFERYGVQLVLAGHEHDYARGAPWRERPFHASNRPVMHVVTGGGGAGLNTPTPGPWLVNWARAFHYLSIDVSDCTPAGACALSLEAIGLDGQPFDSFTLDLRAQQQDAAPPQVAWNGLSNGSVVSGFKPLSAAVSDDQQIVKVDVWVDGALRLVDHTAPYEWTWDTTRELNGDRALELRAHDIAGRLTVSATRIVEVRNPQATIRLLSPSGERVFLSAPYPIRWVAEPGASPLAGFRVDLAPDGKNFQPVAGCAALPASARECIWQPSTAASKAVVRVTATETTGAQVSANSPAFRVQAGTATLSVKFPNQPTTLGLGSTQALWWTTKLGLYGRWDVDVSTDGGGSWQPVARSLFALANEIPWIVDQPLTAQGLVRVTSLNFPLQDVSDGLFKIAQPTLAVTGLPASTTWQTGTLVQVKWTTNLGAYDRLNVRLSTDGGQTFPIVLAGSVSASVRTVTVMVPSAPTSTARVLLEALDNPAWTAMSSANFHIVALK